MKILIIGAGVMANLVKECAIENHIECIGMVDKLIDTEYKYKDFKDVNKDFDVIIDFSHHSLIKEILEFAKEKKRPLLIATTGHSKEDIELINEYSKFIPIVKSSNTSIGVNAINKIVEYAHSLLKGFDIEIIEKHHNRKIDVPSGTAKTLFNILNKNNEYTDVIGRCENKKREPNDIGIHSIRAGNIYGEHSVIFSKGDEIIEIKHEALSRKIFANGALRITAFLYDKYLNNENGLFEV